MNIKNIGIKKIFILVPVVFFCLYIAFPLFSASGSELIKKLETVTGKERIRLLLKISEFYRYKSPEKVVKYSKLCLREATKFGLTAETANAELNLGIGYFQLGNLDLSEKSYGKGLLKAEKIGDRTISGSCLNGLASISMMRGEMDKALRYFKKALNFLKGEKNKDRLAGIFSNISLIYYQKSDYNNALDFMFKALKIYNETGNNQGRGIVLNSIGNVYAKLNNTKQAMDYFLKSLKIGIKTKNLQLEVSTLINIGEIEKKSGNIESSLFYSRKALKKAKDFGNNEYIAICRNNIGEALFNLGKYKEAMKMFKKSFEYFKKRNVNPKIAVLYINMARIYMNEAKLDKAEQYFKYALPPANSYGLKEYLLKLYKGLADLYEKKRDLNQSLKYYKKFISLKDSLIPLETLKKISDMKIKHESEIWEKEKKIKELKIRKQKVVNLFIFTALVLISILSIILFKRYKLKIETAKELETAYAQMEKLANYDPLTHLYNRRSMTERIDIEVVRMGRTGKPFCLIMLDIDDFKTYNDRYGHECGDKILESFSILLQKNLRKQDAASRWGGEEFLILLPETNEKGGYTLAEKIRKKAEATTIEYGEDTIKFTITAGISVYDKPAPVNDCIRASDLAMYKGKKAGKNRVVKSSD